MNYINFQSKYYFIKKKSNYNIHNNFKNPLILIYSKDKTNKLM